MAQQGARLITIVARVSCLRTSVPPSAISVCFDACGAHARLIDCIVIYTEGRPWDWQVEHDFRRAMSTMNAAAGG